LAYTNREIRPIDVESRFTLELEGRIMQISGTLKVAPITTIVRPTAQTKGNSSAFADAVSTATVSKSSSSSTEQNAASVVQVSKMAATYSPTVSGKNYAGSVEEAAGVYVASVPSPPGITAIGVSVQTAEDNLDMKLDALA
jgi:hypothetical protein